MSLWSNIHTYNGEYFYNLGKEAFSMMEELFPICRSLTGNGNRQTLEYISNIIPISLYQIDSGTNVFDWNIPSEWNLKSAKIIAPDNKIVCSSNDTNISVVGYSEPIDEYIDLEALKKNIHTIPDMPDTVPYVTSYYKRRWGFCMTQNMLNSLKDGMYRVIIDSELSPGKMDYADLIIKGATSNEILLSTYFCHPSLANDNLSGLILSAIVMREMLNFSDELKISYRAVFVPETIGAIAYLHENKDVIKNNVIAGIVATCVGDNMDTVTYKRSRIGNSVVDRAAEHLLKTSIENHKIIEFSPIGSDERQYCSPGFNLPVGSLMRTHYYDLPCYHTSDDNMSTISPENMGKMIHLYMRLFNLIENNYKWIRSDGGMCEIQLSKRNLYPSIGIQPHNRSAAKHVNWAMNMADGEHDLLEIANISGLPAWELLDIMIKLEEAGVIKKCHEE